MINMYLRIDFTDNDFYHVMVRVGKDVIDMIDNYDYECKTLLENFNKMNEFLSLSFIRQSIVNFTIGNYIAEKTIKQSKDMKYNKLPNFELSDFEDIKEYFNKHITVKLVDKINKNDDNSETIYINLDESIDVDNRISIY